MAFGAQGFARPLAESSTSQWELCGRLLPAGSQGLRAQGEHYNLLCVAGASVEGAPVLSRFLGNKKRPQKSPYMR